MHYINHDIPPPPKKNLFITLLEIYLLSIYCCTVVSFYSFLYLTVEPHLFSFVNLVIRSFVRSSSSIKSFHSSIPVFSHSLCNGIQQQTRKMYTSWREKAKTYCLTAVIVKITPQVVWIFMLLSPTPFKDKHVKQYVAVATKSLHSTGQRKKDKFPRLQNTRDSPLQQSTSPLERCYQGQNTDKYNKNHPFPF